MKTLKANTKAAQAIKNTYNTPGYNYPYHYFDIFEAYERPSQRKITAWEECKKIRDEHNGRGLVIIGKCSTSFTAYFKDDDGNIYKITKDNIYKAEA